MAFRPGLVASVLLFAVVSGFSTPHKVKLEIRLPAGPVASAEAAELVVLDPVAKQEVHRGAVSIPWRGELDLDRPLGGLRIEIGSAALWAAPLEVPAGASGDVAVDVFARGEIAFADPPGDSPESPGPPPALTVEVASAPKPGRKDLIGKTRLACHLEKDRWRCPAPALPLDLRIEKPGHVPLYFFGLGVQPGRAFDLGRLRFTRGASVSGFVTTEAGEPKGAVVRLGPVGSFGPGERQRLSLRQHQAVANERGFFQLQGVPAGGYRLEATRKGLAATEVAPVEVLEARETALPEPILLQRPAEVELHVSPPVGPLNRAWRLRLIREEAGKNVGGELLETSADESGVGRWTDLQPGLY